jgi:6-phosphofructokinase 1
MGGNGTAAGAKGLHRHLPPDIRCFFVPVTLDSDIAGTECIGQHTAAAAGAERIRRLVADAAAHQRTYVVEMMGSESGFHAVHSCIGGGGHYAILTEPLMPEELVRISAAIAQRRSTVVVVAAGYASADRRREAEIRKGDDGNADNAGRFAAGGRAEYHGVESAADYVCRYVSC